MDRRKANVAIGLTGFLSRIEVIAVDELLSAVVSAESEATLVPSEKSVVVDDAAIGVTEVF